MDRAEVSIGGRRHRRVLRASETFTSAAGPVTVQRTLYRVGSEQAVVPEELRATSSADTPQVNSAPLQRYRDAIATHASGQ